MMTNNGFVRWTQWSDDGMVGYGQMTYNDMTSRLTEFRKKAMLVMDKTGADHVVYGLMVFDGNDIGEVKFYMAPMSDDEFEKDVVPLRNCNVYAVHNRNTVQGKIDQIVDYIVDVGTAETETGQYSVYYYEIERKFPFATEEWLKMHHDMIKEALDGREEVLSETWDETSTDGKLEGFDCNFCGDYCPNWEEDGCMD